MKMINSNKELAVVVLFWNDYDKTIKCLDSLYKQKKIKFNLILVDNNSDVRYTKEVFKWLKKKKIKIFKITKDKVNKNIFNSNKICFYKKNKINYGCGLGHNYGYNFCLKNNFKFIARFDNDMIIPKFTLFKLISKMKKYENINALSPKIMFVNKPNMIWYSGTKISNNLKFQKACGLNSSNGIKDNKTYRGLIKTDAVAGCASIMRASQLRLSGLSDPEFFYGEEDIELSFRLSDTSESLKIDLDTKVYHHVSSTVGKNWGKNIYYNYKYRLLLVKKIGTISDKFFGYLFALLKFSISIFLIFKKKHASRILQKYYALKHFYQNKYGNYDRINYLKVNKFFGNISKETSFLDVIKKIIFEKKNFN